MMTLRLYVTHYCVPGLNKSDTMGSAMTKPIQKWKGFLFEPILKNESTSSDLTIQKDC